jgi:hypothetical protein
MRYYNKICYKLQKFKRFSYKNYQNYVLISFSVLEDKNAWGTKCTALEL